MKLKYKPIKSSVNNLMWGYIIDTFLMSPILDVYAELDVIKSVVVIPIFVSVNNHVNEKLK